MKISIVSDLHLEFGDLELAGGEVLIIAGDACESRTLTKFKYQPETVHVASTAGKRLDRAARFFNEECAKYQQVFYVMGNHEHYHGKFNKTAAELRANLPQRIQLLECNTATIDDYVFMGCSMWTDCNRGDPITIHGLSTMMNDYRTITWNQENYYRKLRPSDTAAVHKQSLTWLKNQLGQHTDKTVVVITHHAPSHLSIAEQYRGDSVLNGGYSSDLSNVMLDYPQIKLWVHGHTHDKFDYEIGQTRVICNPRGYLGHEYCAEDFSELVIDL